MTKPKITLTLSEIAEGAMIGGLRHGFSCEQNRTPAHGFDATRFPALGSHCEGACGEIAFAKWRNLYWPARINNFKEADIGDNIQIRTSSRHDGELVVRNDDLAKIPNHVFVLVTGLCPDYQIHGWIYGHEAKREEFKKAPGGRPPAYFVPQSELRSFWGIHPNPSRGH